MTAAAVPVASPVWRVRARRERGRAWPWWAATGLHGGVLAALLLASIRPPPEALREEGVPLVWAGPEGSGEGAPVLAAPSAPVPPVEAAEPPSPPAPPPVVDAPPVPPVTATAPPGPAPEVPVAPPQVVEAVPVPPAMPLPMPSRDAAASLPPAPPESRPVPSPPASPPRPAEARRPPRQEATREEAPRPPTPPRPPVPRAAPAAPGPPVTVSPGEVAAAGVRLGAGVSSAPGVTQGVGAPQLGCAEAIGYPEDERRRGVTGAVNLRLRVRDNGGVVEARIIESSGSFALDEAAVRGIRRCRFVPAMRDGFNVFGTREYRVVFRLD